MSCCPLIEELLLANCNLINPPYNPGIQSFMFVGECTCLKRLSLVKTQINDDQLQTILFKSPLLEAFTLIYCKKEVKSINLSSVALKRVKLKFSSCRYWTLPFPITITSPITNGIVKVSVNYCVGDIDESWFHGLKVFLAKFAKSNVKLTSYHGYPLMTVFKILRATPLPPRHEVETLKFKRFENLPLLYAFFSICHPKVVCLDRLDTLSKRKVFMGLLRDIRYRGNLKCCNFNDHNKCWRHYIKDAKLYYVIDNEQKPLDMTGLETGLGKNEMITLAIEWENSC